MHPRTTARALIAGLLALSACAGTAQAAGHRTVEPLNQYTVSGRVTTDELARAGFDLGEIKRGGKLKVITTPSQAQALSDKGALVTPANGVARQMAVRATPLTDPTHAPDVSRPWSLWPAPCPGTCSTPLKPLKVYYRELAQRYPDIIKEYVIGRSVLGQEIKAYKMTAGARTEGAGSRPVTMYESTQHAREWIATEVERRLFTWFVDHRGDRDVRA